MVTNFQTKIEHLYIDKIEGICGVKMKIKSTRIKVSQISVEHIDMKMVINEMKFAHKMISNSPPKIKSSIAS